VAHTIRDSVKVVVNNKRMAMCSGIGTIGAMKVIRMR
jgi:hypothetical protein